MGKLNYKKTFLLGFGFFATSITWSVYNAFMPKLLSNFITSSAIIGFIMTFDNYFALFIQPAVGMYSDGIKTRFGRRMPFLMVGMPLAVLFIFLIPNYKGLATLVAALLLMNLSMSLFRSPVIALMPDITPEDERSKANSIINFMKGLATLVAALLLMNLSMSLFRSPVIALMPDITPEDERSKANSIINFMGGIGSLIAFFIGSILWNLSPKYPFYLAGALVLLSFIILFTCIKEKRDVINYEQAEKKINFKEGFKVAFKNPSTKFLLMAISAWFMGYNGIETFFTRYGEMYLGIDVSAAAFSFTFISLSFLVFAIPAGMIGTKLGKKKTITIGLIGAMAVFFILIFIKNILIIRVFFVALGIFWAMININSYPFVAQMSPLIGAMAVFFILIFIKNILIIRVFFVALGIFWAMININSYPFVAQMSPIGYLGTFTGMYYLFSSIANIVSPPLLGVVFDLIGFKWMFAYGLFFMIIAFLFIRKVE